MKTKISSVFSVVLWCLIFLYTPNTATAGIAGSAHDFSLQGWSGGRICVPCHTPHNANAAEPDAPLWNHEVTTANFTMYDSPTLVVKPQSQPQGVTKLCLSCHDGTIALDHFGGKPGTTYIPNEANLSPDLSDDHPVSIKWEHQNETPSCSNCHFAHGQMFSSELPFFNGYVECATCHDVHNSTLNAKFLRLPLQNSEICFHCHNK